jgi:hypothetical protein
VPHDWQRSPGDTPRWVCAQCGGRRTWLAAFERGDATRGFVTKDYDIT